MASGETPIKQKHEMEKLDKAGVAFVVGLEETGGARRAPPGRLRNYHKTKPSRAELDHKMTQAERRRKEKATEIQMRIQQQRSTSEQMRKYYCGVTDQQAKPTSSSV